MRQARFVCVDGITRSLTPKRTTLLIIRYAQQGIPMTLEHLREAIYLRVCHRTPAQRLELCDEISSPLMLFVQKFCRRPADKLKVPRPTCQKAKRFVSVNGVSMENHLATV